MGLSVPRAKIGVPRCRELADALCKGISKRTKFYAWDANGGAFNACLRIEGRTADEPDYLVSIQPVPPAGRRKWETKP